ncbi:TPA: DUF1642 domain-containing protein [Enterococcus faecalis]|nr:DUF1642 domain-containing protein [Enterococcus faecalis]
MNSQELIEKIKYGRMNCPSDRWDKGYNSALEYVINIVQQLDEPKKVVVPQIVADWIKYAKQQGYGFMQSYDPKYTSYPINDNLDKWIDDNEETFAHAWLVGYEVEKEQLYYVFDTTTKQYLGVDKVLNKAFWLSSHNSGARTPLTEQEIKSVDERYWQFAVKVDGE